MHSKSQQRLQKNEKEPKIIELYIIMVWDSAEIGNRRREENGD